MRSVPFLEMRINFYPPLCKYLWSSFLWSIWYSFCWTCCVLLPCYDCLLLCWHQLSWAINYLSLWYFPAAKSWIDFPDWRGSHIQRVSPCFPPNSKAWEGGHHDHIIKYKRAFLEHQQHCLFIRCSVPCTQRHPTQPQPQVWPKIEFDDSPLRPGHYDND